MFHVLTIEQEPSASLKDIDEIIKLAQAENKRDRNAAVTAIKRCAESDNENARETAILAIKGLCEESPWYSEYEREKAVFAANSYKKKAFELSFLASELDSISDGSILHKNVVSVIKQNADSCFAHEINIAVQAVTQCITSGSWTIPGAIKDAALAVKQCVELYEKRAEELVTKTNMIGRNAAVWVIQQCAESIEPDCSDACFRADSFPFVVALPVLFRAFFILCHKNIICSPAFNYLIEFHPLKTYEFNP